jgi:hypothetical protein
MIQANELRLGNLIHFPYLGSNVEVIGIALKDDERLFIQTKLNNNSFFELPEKYNPIELTEEWLLRMGFEKRGLYYHFPNHDIFKLQQYKLNKAFWLRHSSESLDCVRINYVHQLQNLYFALTGEELIIK